MYRILKKHQDKNLDVNLKNGLETNLMVLLVDSLVTYQYRIIVLKNIGKLFITENYLVFKNLMTLVVRVSRRIYCCNINYWFKVLCIPHN